jgi:hypothetical protein
MESFSENDLNFVDEIDLNQENSQQINEEDH